MAVLDDIKKDSVFFWNPTVMHNGKPQKLRALGYMLFCDMETIGEKLNDFLADFSRKKVKLKVNDDLHYDDRPMIVTVARDGNGAFTMKYDFQSRSHGPYKIKNVKKSELKDLATFFCTERKPKRK